MAELAQALVIPAGEQRVIHVFDLNMRAEQARFLREPGALAQVLGVDEIDLDHVEIFPISDLEGLGLRGYLRDGCGISPEQLAADAQALAAVEDYVLLLRSRALRGKETQLTPASQIRHIGDYHEAGADWSSLPTNPAETPESAKLYSAQRPSPRAARSRARRIGAAIFAVVIALILLVVLMLAT
ncbi:hypothetical protein [Phaeobacter porticola]|uniref:Uncharacterized protein n=1 Tax=Phaeobacter porticola TaxID=1844006 RepID=A0A1L3I8H3_9RHOB|nr:hypothetical protein [Phaeobacter porticola]APG48430.1 hypothetical protein PhaeoP97_03055 [Phaeobacter porticola]